VKFNKGVCFESRSLETELRMSWLQLGITELLCKDTSDGRLIPVATV